MVVAKKYLIWLFLSPLVVYSQFQLRVFYAYMIFHLRVNMIQLEDRIDGENYNKVCYFLNHFYCQYLHKILVLIFSVTTYFPYFLHNNKGLLFIYLGLFFSVFRGFML